MFKLCLKVLDLIVTLVVILIALKVVLFILGLLGLIAASTMDIVKGISIGIHSVINLFK